MLLRCHSDVITLLPGTSRKNKAGSGDLALDIKESCYSQPKNSSKDGNTSKDELPVACPGNPKDLSE